MCDAQDRYGWWLLSDEFGGLYLEGLRQLADRGEVSQKNLAKGGSTVCWMWRWTSLRTSSGLPMEM